MAPSTSPYFTTVPALDVRRPDHPVDPNGAIDLVHALATAQSSAAATTSGGVSGVVVGLSVLLVLVGLSAIAAVCYIVVQRKQLLSLGTIRVLYNVDNLAKTTEASNKASDAAADQQEKGATLDVAAVKGEQMYTIDLNDDRSKPKLVGMPGGQPHHILPSHLRRKPSRMTARNRLRIVIPAGVAIPDVELVTTATLPAGTPNTGISSAVSLSRQTSAVSRRNTARTPRSALLSAVTTISSAAIGIVHRREKVEAVYQSNGWAPASIVYLPTNPRDTATRSPRLNRGLTRKSTRRVPTTANTIVAQHGHDEKPVAVA